MRLLLLSLLLISTSAVAQNLSVQLLGRYTDGRSGACEIAAYDATSQQLFITNAVTDSIDVVDCSDFNNMTRTSRLAVGAHNGSINSVAYLPTGHLAAAVANKTNPQGPGKVLFFDGNGTLVNQLTVGALPDMLAVSPDGNKLLVACEGEPSDDYLLDPEGSIAIIELNTAVNLLSAAEVTLLDFQQAPLTIAGAVRKPNTSWAADLEPEYIAINGASTQAAVVCQENNVLVFVDLNTNSITSYKGLGFKDHSRANQGLDANDKDGLITIAPQPVKGVYQPDAIASYTIGGNTYYLSANEGDARDYGGYSSETRIKDLALDTAAFPQAATLQADAQLGRLKTFTADQLGDTDGDGDVDELYSYGGRSFSIWDDSGQLVWDSGDDFAQEIAANHALFFNCNDGQAAKMDNRSDDKGSEPEAITVGQIGNRFFAFIGLERQGGIMVYDVTNPNAPVFETYVHSFDHTTGTATDIAPEGLVFVPAAKSHSQQNLLVVSNEVSGTTTVYEVDGLFVRNRTLAAQTPIAVYPNPTSDWLTVALPKLEEPLAYQLYSALGKTQLEGLLVNQETPLSLEKLPLGCYYLTVKIEGEAAQSFRVIKQ